MIRKPNILFLLVVLLSITQFSCVEEFNIEESGDPFESKLLVNSLFSSDSPWEVEVLRTLPRFRPDLDNEIITDARVEIFDQNDNHMYDLYHVGEGKYKNEDKGPSPKRGYSIKVTSPGLHTVTARGYVPEKSTLLINNFSIITNNDQKDVEVDFEIEDRSKLESYYLWEVVNIGEGQDGGTNSSSTQLSDTWINDLTNNPNDLVNKDREFVGNTSFGDGTYQGSYSSFDGNRRIAGGGSITNNSHSGVSSSETLKEDIKSMLKLDPSIGNPNGVSNQSNQLEKGESGDEDGEGNKIIYNYELRVMTISKELYNYYSSFEEYYQNRGNGSHSNEASFIFYTNVNNGAGIFAGFSESVIQF